MSPVSVTTPPNESTVPPSSVSKPVDSSIWAKTGKVFRLSTVFPAEETASPVSETAPDTPANVVPMALSFSLSEPRPSLRPSPILLTASPVLLRISPVPLVTSPVPSKSIWLTVLPSTVTVSPTPSTIPPPSSTNVSTPVVAAPSPPPPPVSPPPPPSTISPPPELLTDLLLLPLQPTDRDKTKPIVIICANFVFCISASSTRINYSINTNIRYIRYPCWR